MTTRDRYALEAGETNGEVPQHFQTTFRGILGFAETDLETLSTEDERIAEGFDGR